MKPTFGASLFSLTFVLIMANLACYCNGFKQELWIYTEHAYVLYFDSEFADLAKMKELGSITKMCARGRWRFFQEPNFIKFAALAGSLSSTGINCTDFKDPNLKVLSLRHLAANDTDTNALSLYSQTFWTGAETKVNDTEQARLDIAGPILSIVGSGKGSWTLFEGKALNGHSVCLEVPRAGNNFEWAENFKKEINITTIGSVFKGCDNEKLEAYRNEKLAKTLTEEQ